MILAYALRRLDPDRAQDVVAETFTAAWRALSDLPDDPLPWLYRTASFRLANERRSAVRHQRVVVRVTAQPSSAAPDHAALVAESARVRDALLRLEARDREALLLTAWEDLSNADAAFVLGCSLTAFKVRLLRARRRLGRALRDVDDPAAPARQTPARGKPAGPQRPDTGMLKVG